MAKDDSGVMDVSKPGKTPAEPSGRPIIVKSGPMVPDPTLKTDNPAEMPAKDKSENTGVKRLGITINPLGGPRADEKSASKELKAPEAEKPAEPEKPQEPEEKAENPAASDAAVVDAVADQANAKKVPAAQTEEEKKKAEAIEKMIESKQYFVKVRQPKSTKSAKMALVLLLTIVLVFVGFDLAVDAGLLTVDFFTPPIDLIKN